MREIHIFNEKLQNYIKREAVGIGSLLEQSESLLDFGFQFAKEENLIPVATTSGGEYSAILVSLLRSRDELPVIFVDMGPACYTDTTRHEMVSEFSKMGLDVRRHHSKIVSPDRPPTKTEL